MIKTSLMLFKALFTLCLHFENSRQEITLERLKAISNAVNQLDVRPSLVGRFFR